jgi:hypothetical protein
MNSGEMLPKKSPPGAINPGIDALSGDDQYRVILKRIGSSIF